MTDELKDLLASLPPPRRIRTIRDGHAEGVLLATLEAGYSLRAAAKVACVSESAIRNWRKLDERFDRLVTLAQHAGRLALSRHRVSELTAPK